MLQEWVQYPDDYSLRRWLIAALRPSLQKEVLRRGITAEFSSMQDILEKQRISKTPCDMTSDPECQ